MRFEKLYIILFGMLIYNDYNDYRSVHGTAVLAVWDFIGEVIIVWGSKV